MTYDQLVRQAGLEVESYETGVSSKTELFFKLVDLVYEMEKQLFPAETRGGSVIFHRR